MRFPFARRVGRPRTDGPGSVDGLAGKVRGLNRSDSGPDPRASDGQGEQEPEDSTWRRVGSSLRAQMHDRRYEYVQNPDDIRIDVREHVVTLTQPLARAVVGILALVAPHRVLPLVAFGLLVAMAVRRQLHLSLQWTLASGAAVALAVGWAGSARTSTSVHALLLVVLLFWFATDLYVWYDDRLIVTTRRIYRIYGVFTKHGPSMALSGIAYIDVEVSPMGQAFNYGTLILDSAAQRDDPLSHFSHLPDAVEVQKDILALRSAALRTLPRPQDMV